jgi:hypothetical protein
MRRGIYIYTVITGESDRNLPIDTEHCLVVYVDSDAYRRPFCQDNRSIEGEVRSDRDQQYIA